MSWDKLEFEHLYGLICSRNAERNSNNNKLTKVGQFAENQTTLNTSLTTAIGAIVKTQQAFAYVDRDKPLNEKLKALNPVKNLSAKVHEQMRSLSKKDGKDGK